jgi:hypothetical protein
MVQVGRAAAVLLLAASGLGASAEPGTGSRQLERRQVQPHGRVVAATAVGPTKSARATRHPATSVMVHSSSPSTARRKPRRPRSSSSARPSSPSSRLSSSALDFAHVALAWPSVAGAVSYALYRDGSLIARVRATSFTDSLLWPSTSYAYRVEGLSAAGAVISSENVSTSTTALPASGFPRPFAANSVWNTPIGNAPTVADSSRLVSYLVANAAHPNMTLQSWGVSVAEAQPGQPSYSVSCVVWSNCTLGVFGSFRIPLAAAADSSSDAHLAVYDPTLGREWDLWQASRTSGSWVAGAGAAVSMNGNGVAPSGTVGADAANFPLLGGLVRPEEIMQGHIDHALVFTLPQVSKLGHVCPATHNDGSSTDPSALQEGMRVQLDPALDVSRLTIPGWEKTLARAMQVYGMYLRDQGGSLAILAEDSASRGYNAWAKAGLGSGASVSLVGIPWQRFRVVSNPC